MAHRHLVAVCVVCLLCAEHLPCKEHILLEDSNYIKSVQWINTHDVTLRTISLVQPIHDADKIYNKEARNEILSRKKRHADHNPSHQTVSYHRIEMPEVTKIHIDNIFRQFNNKSIMDIHGFEEMIAQLKLNYLFNISTHKSCMSEETFILKLIHGKVDEIEENESENHHHEHNHEDYQHDESKEQIDKTEPNNHINKVYDNIELNAENMMSICPILLYYILNRNTTLSDNSCFDIQHFNTEDPSEKYQLIQMEDKKLVWLYSTLSVVIVSLSGLCGVIVIPIMDKNFYHLILQFLVALAVGTMAGDALLHLLPHAMLPLTPDQDLHTSMMHRGLITMGCIVFSYFFERFIAAIMECRQRKERREKKSQRALRVVRESESLSTNATTCKHKYSSYPYCYDEINMETKDNQIDHHNEEEKMLSKDIESMPINDSKKVNGLIHDNSNDVDNNTLTLSTSLDDGSIDSNALTFNNLKKSGNPMPKSTSANIKVDEFKDEKLTVILREHQSKHHGHSHTHGHVHSPPESLSAVAWMVILGDGLHNFTDGMAIGAAFSSSLAGGFSTAFAVLCHELPHELGDFAVLLKAGMSPKKAICYNLLTAVLCVFGMIAGILVGNTPEASQYIFAGTAGLFIYIALVDMMPELTSSHGKEGSCMLMQCSLQFSGMLIGLICMLFIAIYEHDLKELFTA